jgi:formylglycine-generating enzyme required for sulfatase activity
MSVFEKDLRMIFSPPIINYIANQVLVAAFAVSFTLLTPANAADEAAVEEVGCGTCSKFEMIEPDTFTMGADVQGDQMGPDELPAVEVTIAKPFMMAVTQVTRAQYALFAEATGHRTRLGCWTYTQYGWAQDETADWRNPGFEQTDTGPVVCVSREDALAFIAWASDRDGKSYRLPSEAEWHLASAANLSEPFWGTRYDVCNFGNVPDLTSKNKTAKAGEPCDDGALYTAPVASYQPNPNGLYDMIGNAWEWTADCWTGSYEGLPADGSPLSDTACQEFALRGHSWTDAPGPVRPQTRYSLSPVARQSMVSFRLAMDVPEAD